MPWDIILGGLTGLVGNAIGAVFKHKTTKENNRHKEEMVSLESAAMIAETEANIQIEKQRIEGAVELADTEAYQISQKEGRAPMFAESYMKRLFAVEGAMNIPAVMLGTILVILFGLVDLFRALMRPSLTAYLVGLSTWITYTSWKILEGLDAAISADTAVALFSDATHIVIYLTVSCVTWWFGDRRIAKFLMKKGTEGI